MIKKIHRRSTFPSFKIKSIIKGDKKIPSISAASIIANNDFNVKKKLENWRISQTRSVKKRPK